MLVESLSLERILNEFLENFRRTVTVFEMFQFCLFHICFYGGEAATMVALKTFSTSFDFFDFWKITLLPSTSDK